MWNFNPTVELSHHGILGMKWGVRRTEAQLARVRRKADKGNWSEDAKAASEIKTKKVKQMSNAELKKLNERIRLEQEYSRLTKSNTSVISAGGKFASEVAKEIAKESAKNYIKQNASKGVAFIKSMKK